MNFQSDIFNKPSIYNMLFFNIKTVLEYPTLDELAKNKPEMLDNWKILMGEKFNTMNLSMEALYSTYGINYSEFSKIVCITYGNGFMNDKTGLFDRKLNKIIGNNEALILETFFDVLNNMNSDNMMFCSFNGNKDIQTLIKRYILKKNEINTIKTLPVSIKKVLNLKPWESGIIGVNTTWKFNNYEDNYPSFAIISDFIGLRKNTNLMTDNDLSNYYWDKIEIAPTETFKNIELQSMNITNMLIQFINEIRNI